MRNPFFLITVLALVSLAACGESDGGSDKDAHSLFNARRSIVAEASARPSGQSMLLNLLIDTDPGVGDNFFELLSSEGRPVEVLKVNGDMPSMGHGTAEDPQIDGSLKQLFLVPFQMPGSWLIELEFRIVGSSSVEAVEFDIEVQ